MRDLRGVRRTNGCLGGHGGPERPAGEIRRLGLSGAAREVLLAAPHRAAQAPPA